MMDFPFDLGLADLRQRIHADPAYTRYSDDEIIHNVNYRCKRVNVMSGNVCNGPLGIRDITEKDYRNPAYICAWCGFNNRPIMEESTSVGNSTSAYR